MSTPDQHAWTPETFMPDEDGTATIEALRDELETTRLLLAQAEQYARDLQDGMRRVVEWGARVDRVNPVRREKVGDVIKLGEETARYAPSVWDGWTTVRRVRLVGSWEPVEVVEP